MAAVGAALGVAGTALSYEQSRAQAKREQYAADFQAKQLETQAGQEQAASQRVAEDQRRAEKYTESRALAVAAASGGGASDKTVTDVIGRIAQEGAYRSSLALYQGDADARQMRLRAAAVRYTGRQQESAWNTQALTTVLNGGSSLYLKYGANQPDPNSFSRGSRLNAGQSYLDAGSAPVDYIA